LVSVSFVTFGVLFLRDGQRMLGVVGCVAGVCTAVGQLPLLSPVFLVANVAFLLWYASLARLFARTPRPTDTAPTLEASVVGVTVPAS
jgi:arginine exporter protein ArgO